MNLITLWVSGPIRNCSACNIEASPCITFKHCCSNFHEMLSIQVQIMNDQLLNAYENHLENIEVTLIVIIYIEWCGMSYNNYNVVLGVQWKRSMYLTCAKVKRRSNSL